MKLSVERRVVEEIVVDGVLPDDLAAVASVLGMLNMTITHIDGKEVIDHCCVCGRPICEKDEHHTSGDDGTLCIACLR